MNLPKHPIFIVGYPRSGTTLLQRLLVTQTGIFSFPETHYFNVIEKEVNVDALGNILPQCLEKVYAKITEKMELQFTAEEKKSLYCRAEEKNLSVKGLFEYIVARFLTLLYPNCDEFPSFRWVEKTPNHAHFLERIIQLYPDMKVLHIIRHPVPAVFSRKLKFPFNKETPLAELARRWVRSVRDVENFKEKHPAHIHVLRYEDLVADINKEMIVVAEFLQIPWDVSFVSEIHLPSVADALILPSEPWKLQDVNRDIANTNQAYRDRISQEEAHLIEEVTMNTMTQYHYSPYCEVGGPGSRDVVHNVPTN